MLISQPE